MSSEQKGAFACGDAQFRNPNSCITFRLKNNTGKRSVTGNFPGFAHGEGESIFLPEIPPVILVFFVEVE